MDELTNKKAKEIIGNLQGEIEIRDRTIIKLQKLLKKQQELTSQAQSDFRLLANTIDKIQKEKA